MHHIFIHSSVDGLLVSFHILAIITNVAMNTGERRGIYVVGLVFLFFSGRVVRTRIVGSWGCPLYHRGLGCKSRKSRDTWGNRQVWPWSTKWRRTKANRILPRKCTGHSKYPLPTAQETILKMDITRWSIPKSDWLYSLKMEKCSTVSKNKTRSWLWLRSWTPCCHIQT